MTRKEEFRLNVALKLNRLFSNKFCWADLVSWAYSSDSFWSVFKLWNHARGCQIDGEEGKACYCGKFHHPDYFKL